MVKAPAPTRLRRVAGADGGGLAHPVARTTLSGHSLLCPPSEEPPVYYRAVGAQGVQRPWGVQQPPPLPPLVGLICGRHQQMLIDVAIVCLFAEIEWGSSGQVLVFGYSFIESRLHMLPLFRIQNGGTTAKLLFWFPNTCFFSMKYVQHIFKVLVSWLVFVYGCRASRSQFQNLYHLQSIREHCAQF